MLCLSCVCVVSVLLCVVLVVARVLRLGCFCVVFVLLASFVCCWWLEMLFHHVLL